MNETLIAKLLDILVWLVLLIQIEHKN